MKQTFFFYDLETSGFGPRKDRIMQFAGQRTDMNLNKIGEPVNILIRLNDDVLPSPEALMVTGISPQKTVDEGYTEAEFAQMAAEEFFTEGTIAVGYNSVRFDDEHMRHLFWRNFYDPYEWQWKDERSRWDLLDVVRMTRALRPESINWPFIENELGEKIAANKLELLTKLNGIEHENAHDAMSDVDGLIDVAKLLREKQPQIFDYLLKIRDKAEVQKLVNLENSQPFVYTSGRFDAKYEKTVVAFPVAPAANRNVIVWDTRFDATEFLQLSASELAAKLFATGEERQAEGFVPVPAKVLQYNKCPAVAPFGVLTDENKQRLDFDEAKIKKHIKILKQNPHFVENLRTAFESKAEIYESRRTDNEKTEKVNPEAQLYGGFLPDGDRLKVEAVRNADARQLADFHPDFADERLPGLLLHYKARSFPKSLSADEKQAWEQWRSEQIAQQTPAFLESLQQIAARENLTKDEEFILEEMKLWFESVVPDSY